MEKETYLGDGLYVRFDGYHFELFTDSRVKVYLDPHVTDNFLQFVEICREEESDEANIQ